MRFDVESDLGAVDRSVSSPMRDGQPARAVTLSRTYTTTVEDLWDAVTNGERIPRWFLPVTGELERGGRYQLAGNAGGVITACERPSHFALTWEFGDDLSWVDVRLADDGAGRARLTLTHTALLSEHWSTYGPGATGVGWELGLMGLAIHLTQPAETKPDEAAFATTLPADRYRYPLACVSNIREYSPLTADSSSCVPCWTTRPESSTTMRSARRTFENR